MNYWNVVAIDILIARNSRLIIADDRKSPFNRSDHFLTTEKMRQVINVLLDTFPGLSLPATLCLPLDASSSTRDLIDKINEVLPPNLPRSTRLILTSTLNVPIYWSSTLTLADLTKTSVAGPQDDESILPLRLSAPLCGGKGGFGSQLRAAGGRMSSRKRRQNAELASGSARNLDGRRLRTITEAKNLATYLATKPEMDRKEKEERRKRWETVIQMAEQREADMKAGKTADGKRKGLSEEWIEEKEEVGENVRNAVKQAMLNADKDEAQDEKDESSGSGGSVNHSEDDSEDDDPMELDEEEMLRLKVEAESGDVDAIWVLKNKLKIPANLLPKTKPQRRFAGFDDEDDDISSSEDEKDNGKGTTTV